MRILLVSDTFSPTMGGIETQVQGLAQQLSERGHQVCVATCTPQGEETPENTPYRVVRSVWANPMNAPIDPRAGRRFMALIEKWRPDVVHLHLGEVTPGVQDLLLRMRGRAIPTVVTVHSLWNRQLTIPAYRALARWCGLGSEPIVWSGVSELVNRHIREVLGDSVHVATVPNGIETSRWRCEKRAHSGLVAVTATRFAPRKRVGELIDMYEALHRKWTSLHPGTPLPLRAVLAGEGPEWDRLARRVGASEMADHLILPGRMSADELRMLYAESDLFVAPSVRESASIAGREALAAGLVVLTRSQSGLAEAVDDGVSGFAADTDARMVELLQWACDNPDLMAEMGERNARAQWPFDWAYVAETTCEVYRRARECVSRAMGQ